MGSVRSKIGSVDQLDMNNIVDRPVSIMLLLEKEEEVDENLFESP